MTPFSLLLAQQNLWSSVISHAHGLKYILLRLSIFLCLGTDMLLTFSFRERLKALWLASCFFCLLILEIPVVKAALVFTVEPLTQAVTAGKPVYMNCTATTGKGSIAYSWTHNGANAVTGNTRQIIITRDNGVSLYIPKADVKRDRGNYVCTASKKSGVQIVSTTATLSVNNICQTPRITTSAGAVPVQGHEISLRCRCSNSSPTPTYSWTKDGQPVVINGTKVILDGKYLKITNLVTGDDGAYKCKAKNVVGISQGSAVYHVKVIDGGPPVFKTKPTALTVIKKGSSQQLHCSADGKPAPFYEWRKADDTTPLKNDSSYTVFSNGTLLIKSMDKGKAGKYKCTAKNVISSPTVDGVVKQAYLNDIVMQDEHLVPKGQPFDLVCKKPKGVSEPVVHWKKSDGSPISKPYWLKDTQTLAINKTTMKDTASFKCIATNEAGSVEAIVMVTVSVPPKIVTKPKDTVVKEGETVVLECSGSGIPKPTIKWTKGKDNKEVVSDERHRISPSGSLTISKSTEEDSGIYKCIALAANGWKDEETVNTTVLGKVRIKGYILPLVKFNADSDRKLSCDFEGHGPIKVKWGKNGLDKLPDRMIPEKNTLRFTHVKKEDAGEYYCTGSNSFSSKRVKINVSVYVFPKFDLKPKNTTVLVGTSLWIHCNATGIPKPKISWGKERIGGDKLDKEHFTQHKNGTLYIKEVRPTDEGKYYCIAGNAGNWQQITIMLKVTGIIPVKTRKQSGNMGRTIGIAIGCAAAYIVLVVGLMIYCKGRRAQHASKKDAELRPMNGDVDIKEDGINELTPMYPRRNYDKMQFPRHDLEALRTVGNGSYGRAFIARASGIKDGEKETMVVVKALMSKDDIVKEDFTKEIETLANLCHDNIVCLLGVCREEEPFYMIFEHLEKGDLKQMLVSCYENGRNNFTSGQKLTICGQVVSGMKYLAASGFTHKDLAARNCAVGKDLEVKIGFLSLSYDLYNAEYYRFNNMLIPLRWMAPEAIFDDEFSEKSDVWSFGVLIWEIYTLGSLPYHDRPDEEVLKCVRDDLRLPQPDNCPDNMVEMMRRCWQNNPDDRPTLSELADEISSISIDSHV